MCDDERIFEKPKEFIPERWGRDRPLGEFHAFAAQPFGLGTRMCVGRRIAEQGIYTFLTRVRPHDSCIVRFDSLVLWHWGPILSLVEESV